MALQEVGCEGMDWFELAQEPPLYFRTYLCKALATLYGSHSSDDADANLQRIITTFHNVDVGRNIPEDLGILQRIF
jgi:hypothetical protein